jgi:hypothetical protein
MSVSVFEAIMLVCFGAAWPVSIYKSWRSRSVAGKSVVFLFIVEIGYISGIIYKLTANLDAVVFLYFLNALMVAVDILLYYRNGSRSNLSKAVA